MTTKRQREQRVVTAAMLYYRWLRERDFVKGDFAGPKGKFFDACTDLAIARKRKK